MTIPGKPIIAVHLHSDGPHDDMVDSFAYTMAVLAETERHRKAKRRIRRDYWIGIALIIILTLLGIFG